MSNQYSDQIFEVNDLFVAFADGDAQKAAVVLRQLDGLGAGELELLADLLDGQPGDEKLYPFKLELKPRKPGRPTNYLYKRARLFTFGLMIDRAQKADPKHGKVKLSAAIADVSKTKGVGTTVLKEAWSLYKCVIRRSSKVAKSTEYSGPDKA